MKLLSANFCAFAWLISFGTGMSMFLWWELFDHPYFYKQFSAVLDTPGPIYPGDTVFVRRTYCVNIRQSTVVTKLTDGEVHTLPAKEFFNTSVPCDNPETKDFPTTIPRSLSPGSYDLKGYHIIVQNWLRTDIIEYPPVKLVIAARRGD